MVAMVIFQNPKLYEIPNKIIEQIKFHKSYDGTLDWFGFGAGKFHTKIDVSLMFY